MGDVRERYRRLLTQGEGTDRLQFFSDAVFAIALTLLVLDIRLPEDTGDDTLPALLGLWPELLAYALTFAILGLNWVGHHRKFRVIVRFDGVLLWWNLLFLAFVALTPFPTSILSDEVDPVSVVFYAIVVAMLSLLQAVIWMSAWRRKLLSPEVDAALYRYVLANVLVAPVVFAASIPIALFWDPTIAMLFWIAIWPASQIVERVSRSRG
jgi:uncharacterized membrane protein